MTSCSAIDNKKQHVTSPLKRYNPASGAETSRLRSRKIEPKNLGGRTVMGVVNRQEGTKPTYFFLHTSRIRSHRQCHRAHSSPHSRVHLADAFRRVVCPGRGLGRGGTRNRTSRLVAVGVMGTTRDKKVAQGKKSLNVMRGTSTVCAAVPHEGRAIGC